MIKFLKLVTILLVNQLLVKAAIDPVIDVTIDAANETRVLRVKYKLPAVAEPVIDGGLTPRELVTAYRFQLSDSEVPVQDKLVNDTNQVVVFDGLVSGRLYNLTVWPLASGGQPLSVPIIERSVRVPPEPIGSISVESVSDSQVTLSWPRPSGDHNGYEIRYLDADRKNLVVSTSFVEKVDYRQLKPQTNYTFSVTTLSGYGTPTVANSAPVKSTVLTSERAARKLANLRVVDVQPRKVTLEWALPDPPPNTVLTGYKVSYLMDGEENVQHMVYDTMYSRATVSGLIPGKKYWFEVQGTTNMGISATAYLSETTPIWPPPSPPDYVVPEEVSHTATTITIRFRKNYFTDANGAVGSYSVIVAEQDDSGEATVPEQMALSSWHDVHKHTVWPPYQATEPYNPFNGSLYDDFVIGSEDCSVNTGRKYCNGQLKPATSYKIKIRGYAATDKYTDTVHIVVTTNSLNPIKPSQSGPQNGDNKGLQMGVFMPLVVSESKDGRDIIDMLMSMRKETTEDKKSCDNIYDLMSSNRIAFTDLQLRPYRHDYESTVFQAFSANWMVRARVNDSIQSCDRRFTYQLVLKTRPTPQVTVHYVILKGPSGDVKFNGRLYRQEFNSHSSDSLFQAASVHDSRDCAKLSQSKAINFRIFMFNDL